MAKKLKQHSSKKSKKYANNLAKNATKAEKLFRELLRKCGVQFMFQYTVVAPGSFYILDFYLQKEKICFEIDGSHHYTDPIQVDKDRRRDEYLAKKGVKVVRFTNEEVYKMTSEELLLKGYFKPSEQPTKNKVKILPYEEPWIKPVRRKKYGNPKAKTRKKPSKPLPTYSAYDLILARKHERMKRIN